MVLKNDCDLDSWKRKEEEIRKVFFVILLGLHIFGAMSFALINLNKVCK